MMTPCNTLTNITAELNFHSSSQSQPSQVSPSSSQKTPQSMAPPIVHRTVASIGSILNTGPATALPAVVTSPQPVPAPPQSQPQPHLILDRVQLAQLHSALVEKTDGFSIEQLEQINASLMATVWRARGDWNRDRIVTLVSEAFNDTMADLEELKTILPNSVGTDEVLASSP